MQVLKLIESLSAALSSKPKILIVVLEALLGNNCSEIDVRDLLVLVPLSVGPEVLNVITSDCVRQMKGFAAKDSTESVNMSKLVPYLQDDIFAEYVVGIHRETLEAATPNQAASMTMENCSFFHLEGLIKESQLHLRPACFAISLRSHLSSVSYLSPDVIDHFLKVESVRNTIPVEILKYPIPSEAWGKLPSKSALSFAGFKTDDWSRYINPNLPDEVLDLAISKAIEEVQIRAIKEMARRHFNASLRNSLLIRNIQVVDRDTGFLAFNLDSGAKVFIKRASNKDGKPSEFTEVHIKVKSGHDQDGGVGGLAHLTEHVVLNTPVNFGGQNESLLRQSLKSSGWSVDGTTFRDNTVLEFEVSDNFHDLCRVSKAFSVPSFSMTTVAAEIKHVESECKLNLHVTDYAEMIYPHLHPQNPAKIFGSGNLLSLTRDDILEKVNEFYRSNYCAENMEIYVSSPLSSEIVGLMIQEFFSGLPRCEKPPSKDLPSDIWASNVDDVFHVYKQDSLLDENLYAVYAFPCKEDEYICRTAIERVSMPKGHLKSKMRFSSSGIFYVITNETATMVSSPLQENSLIQELQAIYYENKHHELETKVRILRVAVEWTKLLEDPKYHRFIYFGKLPKRLWGSANLIKHPYSSRLVYLLEPPSNKVVKPVVYANHFLSMKISFSSEKSFLKLAILKLAQKLGIESALPHFLIDFSKTCAVLYKELDYEYCDKDYEAVAKLLRGELPDEFRPVFAAALMKFNNLQKAIYRIPTENSVDFLKSKVDFLLGAEDSKNMTFYGDIGFPLQLDQWSCISKWKVSVVTNVEQPPNDSSRGLQDVFDIYFPPVSHKKLVPVLPKANETFYVAAESPFDDNAVAFSFILDEFTKPFLTILTLTLPFLVFSFFRFQNNSAYLTGVKVSDRDFRVIIQSFQDPHYLFNLFNQFIIELPNFLAKEYPQFPTIGKHFELLRDYLILDKCGVLLIELWSSKELDWEIRKEAHLRYLEEQKGDKLKVYHNYCDYPTVEIQ